jgi:hypothetical protein
MHKKILKDRNKDAIMIMAGGISISIKKER